MADYRDQALEFDGSDVALAALSVDAPSTAEAMRQQLRLPFPVLCDPRRSAIERLGLLRRFGFDIAYPATIVLGSNGQVIDRMVEMTYVRLRAKDVLDRCRQWKLTGRWRRPRRRFALPTLTAYWQSSRNVLRSGLVRRRPR